METITREQLDRAVEYLNAVSDGDYALSGAWDDLTEEDKDTLHIDGIHVPTGEFTGVPSRCDKCNAFAKSYGKLFTWSFDDWAFELSALVEDVRERILALEEGGA